MPRCLPGRGWVSPHDGGCALAASRGPAAGSQRSSVQDVLGRPEVTAGERGDILGSVCQGWAGDGGFRVLSELLPRAGPAAGRRCCAERRGGCGCGWERCCVAALRLAGHSKLPPSVLGFHRRDCAVSQPCGVQRMPVVQCQQTPLPREG